MDIIGLVLMEKGFADMMEMSLITITEKDGLSSDVCYFILENNDELYIGTLNGISILKNDFSRENKDYKFRYISKNEGIPSGELNQGAYYKDNDGFLMVWTYYQN